MGIYTNYSGFTSAHDWASEIPANEAYDAAFGCAHILADCQANDMALFEHAIRSDISEVMSIQEGVGYVNENAFTDIIKKIVEMFKKLLAKIKGIFSAFLAKLTGAFKNGKDLVRKYEKQIIKYSNWKDFKCKGIRVPKSGKEDIKDAITKLFEAHKKSAASYVINTTAGGANITDTGIPGYDTVKKIEDAEAEDIKNALAGVYISGVTDIKDMHTEVMDILFDDEETLEGDDQVKSASYFSAKWIKGVLNDEDNWEKDVKKFNEKLEKNINTIIDNLNKDDDNLAKVMSNDETKDKRLKARLKVDYASGDDNKVDKSNHDIAGYTTDIAKTGKNAGKSNYEAAQKAIHALQKMAGNEQEVITKVTAEYMTIVKFAMAQARKVWTAAAAWSSGVHKESVEYVNAVAECAAEQFYTNMESVH